MNLPPFPLCELHHRAVALSNAAVALWGKEAQRWMVVEELGEVLDALGKRQRQRATKEELAEEIADAHLVLIELACLENISQVEVFRQLASKVDRAEARIAAAGTAPEKGARCLRCEKPMERDFRHGFCESCDEDRGDQ